MGGEWGVDFGDDVQVGGAATFGRLGVRHLGPDDQRRVARITALLYLVCGGSILQSSLTAPASVASPRGFLFAGMAIVIGATVVLVVVARADDELIQRGHAPLQLTLLFGAGLLTPGVLYLVGIQGRGHAGSAVYVMPLILGFYLFTRHVAVGLLGAIAVGHGVLLSVSDHIVAPFSQYLFLMAVLASTGVLLGGLVDRLDRAARSEERARHQLEHMNRTLEERVQEQSAQLTREVAARLEEVRASRARLVQVSDTARRQVERDLHDGAQQRLVTLALRLRNLESDVRTADFPDAIGAGRILQELSTLSTELALALKELRELARGMYPSVLSAGLRPAVEQLVGRHGAAVDFSCDLERRLPPAIELTTYFVIAEALTNAMRHAGGAKTRVCIADHGDRAEVVIADGGPGGADPEGRGLSGLSDRVEAVGGSLTVTSAEGCGTVVRAELPTSDDEQVHPPEVRLTSAGPPP